MSELKKSHTQRGFALGEFEDDYGKKCSLQESSNVRPAIWLGVDNADPKIMASLIHFAETGELP